MFLAGTVQPDALAWGLLQNSGIIPGGEVGARSRTIMINIGLYLFLHGILAVLWICRESGGGANSLWARLQAPADWNWPTDHSLGTPALDLCILEGLLPPSLVAKQLLTQYF